MLCCLGIWCNAIIGLGFGDDAKTKGHDDLAKTAFIVLNLPPILFSVLQILCMLTCFKNDTPVAMAKSGDEVGLNDFMAKLYNDKEIAKERAAEILESVGGDAGQPKEKLTLGNALCGDNYKRSSTLAMVLAIMQQLSGINTFLSFGGAILPGNPLMTNFMLQGVNLAGAFIGMFVIAKFGRRTLMGTF